MLDRIMSYFTRRKRIRRNANLIRKVVLRLGYNSDIENLEILFATDLKHDAINVVIGDDCILHGKIILYNIASKVIIGNRVYIGPQTTLFCNRAITIENDVLLSWGITIIDTNAHSIRFEERKMDVLNWKKGLKNWENIRSAPVLIRSKVWVGFNSIITKGVTIGQEAIISCGSVVVKNVEENSVVGGNPSRLIKRNEA